MTLALSPETEPIPGYHITQRLGTGGYGEVWKAEAPGGLQKAIKFIYGYLNEDKATRELKALNRIKQIRHPFLLSIERIEVIEGQLVIVTELADGSLKDHFQTCKDRGLTAIPRDELLAFLRDSADALDFLSENVLQHLDVKPENLLLVGGRTKVADFGLLKDIHDRTCSALGGMTPVYAAPELFDGRPSAASDQYSLAIVYQEMLTGTLPFPGATAAQLTFQHLHCRPRLESLPACDVEVIAKALSKNPQDRFPSSRALIDALIRAGSGAKSSQQEKAQRPDGSLRETTAVSGHDTDAPADSKESARLSPGWLSSRPALAGNKSPSGGGCDSATKSVPPPSASVKNLPPITLDPAECGLRPTLFVGIGGTAGMILRRLRRRLYDRFGPDQVPLLRTLLIDTDPTAIAPQTDAEWELTPADTLAMPLRKPQEYREDSLELLQWLSRRWLYNIPRSLKTEGLRPLGRLALVDHAHVLFERLREMLGTVLAADSIEKAQQTTGLKLRTTAPRIFVVASISGGTGSGMVLDVAYVVRMLLADMGLPDQDLCGLLVHSTQRNATAKDLAVANAYACLSELYHYAKESYPGDAGCELRTFQQHSTFPSAYFVQLGDRLSDDEFSQATDTVAEYLYLDAATAGGALFDKCRASQGASETDQEFQFRTFGLCQLGADQDLPARVSECLTRQILHDWAEGSTGVQSGIDSAPSATDNCFDAVVAKLKLDLESLVEGFRTELAQSCSESVIAHLSAMLVHELPAIENESRDRHWARLVASAKQSLGLLSTDGKSEPLLSLTTVTNAFLGRTVEAAGAELTQWVTAVPDGPGVGLAGALIQCQRMIEWFRQLEQQLNALGRDLQETISLHSTSRQPPATSRKAARRVDESPAALASSLAALIGLFVEQKSIEGAARFAGTLLHRFVSLSESLVGIRRETLALADRLSVDDWASATPVPGASAGQFDSALQQLLAKRLPNVAAGLRRQVTQLIVAPQDGLIRLLSTSGEQLLRLPGRIRSLARRAVVEELKQIDIAAMVLADTEQARNNLRQCIRSARPAALQSGGAQRVVVVAPSGTPETELADVMAPKSPEKPTILFDSDCNIVVCCEGEQIALKNVAAILAHNDPQCVEVSRRLHTRVDVKWSAF